MFNFNNNEVSVIINDNNEPMFVAKDISEILGYKNTQTMTRRLDDDEKGMQNLHTLGGTQNVTVINESGLYSSILGSNKPEAKIFKKWVTSQVLPSIRKHGMYANEQTIDKMIENPDFIIKLATELKTERAEKERLKYQNELQEAEIMKAVPKVQYFEQVLQSNSTYNTNQIAKELGMSAIGLNHELNNLGIQYKQAGTWLLYAKYQDKGYTKTKTHSFTDNHGNQQTSMSTVWTEKGRLFIHNNLRIPKAG